MQRSPVLVPICSSPAGSCLTAANWQEAGIHTASYYLASLLMKPGFEQLNAGPNIAAYVAWPEVVLNAAMLPTKTGHYHLQSSFDGRHMHYTAHDILGLLSKLSPRYAVLPQGVMAAEAWAMLPSTTFPFFHPSDRPKSEETRAYGVYLAYDNQRATWDEFTQQLADFKELSCYVTGDFDLTMLEKLSTYCLIHLESNRPADDAYTGHLYSKEGTLAITDAKYATQFIAIDEQCTCAVCDQKLTRAYLHHLYQHTPLLCQRFLIQHNISYVAQQLQAWQ